MQLDNSKSEVDSHTLEHISSIIPRVLRCPQSPGLMLNVLTGERYAADCKRWDCQPCGKRRAKQIYHRLVGHRFERLVTLTAPANTGAASETVRRFNYAWKLWKQWLTRIYGKFDYLWSNEAGSKTGQLHKHVAMPWFWFDYKRVRTRLVELSRKACIGVVCDFGKKRPVNYKKAVAYCLSYVLKDRSNFPKHARRVQTNVRKPKEAKQLGWFFFSVNAYLSDRTRSKLGLNIASGRTVLGNPDSWLWSALTPALALIPEEKLHAVLLDGSGQGAAK